MILKIIIGALASHRLAVLISNDTVPFEPLRLYIGRLAFSEQQQQKEKGLTGKGFYQYLSKGIGCINCTGMWASLLMVLLLMPFGNKSRKQRAKEFLIYWLAIAGLQIKLGENYSDD